MMWKEGRWKEAHPARRTQARGQAVPGPQGCAVPARGGCAVLARGGTLTGHGLLVADAFIEAAAKLLAAIPADVVVAYVIQRDVTHCKADARRRHPGPAAPADSEECRAGTRGGFCYGLHCASHRPHSASPICKECNF